MKKLLMIIFVAAFLIPTLMFSTAEAKSLWRDGGWNIYSDRKAHGVGDILTIIINESTTQTASKSRSNSKSGNVNLNAGTGIFHFLAAASASGSDSFSAEGSATDTNQYLGQVTVTVVEILPNGNFLIEGNIATNTRSLCAALSDPTISQPIIPYSRAESPTLLSNSTAKVLSMPNSVRAFSLRFSTFCSDIKSAGLCLPFLLTTAR